MTSIYGAGRLDRQIRIVRRSVGQTEPDGPTLWANVRPTGESTMDMDGVPVRRREAVITVRSSAYTQALVSGDRIELNGDLYDVDAVPLPDIRSGMVSLNVVEAVTAGLMDRAFTAFGRRITLERAVPNGQQIVVPNVRARLWGATATEIAAGVKSSGRHIVILAADVPTDTLPLRTNDVVRVDGQALRFAERPDDQTHRDGDVLLAIEGLVS